MPIFDVFIPGVDGDMAFSKRASWNAGITDSGVTPFVLRMNVAQTPFVTTPCFDPCETPLGASLAAPQTIGTTRLLISAEADVCRRRFNSFSTETRNSRT
jgi:hypothetical protein